MRFVDILTENDDDHYSTMEKTGFWGKQGAGCLVLSMKTKRILLSHRSVHVNEPNTYGTFGGAIDEEEDSKNAALRELHEETGCSLSIVKEILPLLVFESPRGDFRYFNFLVIINEEFEPRPEPEHAWETQGHVWFDFNDQTKWPKPLHPGVIRLFNDVSSVSVLKRHTT